MVFFWFFFQNGNKLIRTDTHSHKALAAGHFLWQTGMLLQVFDLPQVRQMDGSSFDGEGGHGGMGCGGRVTLFDYLWRPNEQYLIATFFIASL